MAKIGKIIRLRAALWSWLGEFAKEKTDGNITAAVEVILTEKKGYEEKKVVEIRKKL